MFFRNCVDGIHEEQGYGVAKCPHICSYVQWVGQENVGHYETIRQPDKNGVGSNWDELLGKTIIGYFGRTMKDGHSLFFYLNEFNPSLVSLDEVAMARIPCDDERSVQ